MPNLIGTGNNQVPTNGMLGGLAYQSPDNAIIRNLELTNLSGHNSLIPSTATDVFVYDTRKDSDGGAWRKRTQHTSWYNETLNTATRGSRRDFPAVAVIVRETGKLTIYDGDDPDMPMWMVFEANNNTSTSYLLEYYTTGGTSVSALNGIITSGHNSNGATTINFINEKSIRYRLTASSGTYEILASIANRNTFVSITFTPYANIIGLVNSAVNDVAMTVLPNAPIDSTTGLPTPTIAVATNGGTSIIRDDGTVVNSTSNTGYPAKRIDIKPTGELFHQQGSGSNEGVCYNFPFTRISGVDLGTYANSSTFWYASAGVGNASNYLGNSTVAPTAIVAPTSSSLNIGDTRGLTFVSTNRGVDVASHSSSSTYSLNNGMVAYATSSYNSGWMHGDIKGAWLSDTSTASVTGTELITNGDFSTSTLTSYLSINSCSLSVVSNQLRITSTISAGYCEFYAAISDSTKYHYFSFQFVGASGGTAFGVYGNVTGYVSDANAGWSNSSYTTSRSTGTYTLLIPPGNTIVGFVFNVTSLGQTWTFDNISLRPILELDRSVKNRGLAVYGTITKSAVATGSNLVAYSGFSASNYFLQNPISASPGTGDFSLSFWIKPGTIGSGTGNYFHLFSLGTSTTAGQASTTGFVLKMTTTSGGSSSGYVPYFYNGAGTDYGTYSSSTFFPLGVWTHCVAMRKSGIPYIYINGVLSRTGTSWTSNLTDTYLSIGSPVNNYTEYGGDAAVALLRYSLSTPSPEQILKIYNDEKALFQPNSQCTLYGSSDAVTALAYDDATRLIHVGTSSGRSVFQGLERVDNTTTAVSTAISVSNGLVAEQ